MAESKRPTEATAFCAPQPRTAGILALSRRHACRRVSVQSRNDRSFPRQMRTSVSHVRSQKTEIARGDKPGLAFRNASATSRGVTDAELSRLTYSDGIFTAARALRTSSK